MGHARQGPAVRGHGRRVRVDGHRDGVGDPLGTQHQFRVGDVRGDGGAGQPAAEDRGREVRAARGGHGDRVTRSGPGVGQQGRDRGRGAPEIPVGRRAFAGHDRGRTRVFRDVPGDRGEDGVRSGGSRGRVEHGVVGGAPVVQLAQRPVRRARRRDQQGVVALQQQLDLAAVEHLGAVDGLDPALLRRGQDDELEVELAVPRVDFDDFGGRAAEARRGPPAEGQVVEHVPEHRGAPGRTGALDLRQQDVHRHVRMRDGLEEQVPHAAAEHPERLGRVDPHAQRDDVDVVADRALGLLAADVHREPDGEVVAGAVGVQQQVVGGEQHDDVGCLEFLLQRGDDVLGGRGERADELLAAQGRLRAFLAAAPQAGSPGVEAAQVFAPEREALRLRLGLRPERDGRAGVREVTGEHRVVGGGEFLQEDRHRRAVEDEVVHGHADRVVLGAVVQADAQQRRSVQSERPGDQLPQPAFDVGAAFAFEADREGREHRLGEPGVVGVEDRSQGVVAAHQLGDGFLQDGPVQPARHPQRDARHVVDAFAGHQPFEQPEPFFLAGRRNLSGRHGRSLREGLRR
nr:hypothetical protein [Amycolatopsis vancoresmycina]